MLRDWKQKILNNWSFMRIVRLILATIILIEAWKNSETLFAIIGGVLFFQSVLNMGCCGSSGCDTDHSQKRKISSEISKEDVIFEEVK